MLPGATSRGRHNQPKRPRSSLKTKLKKSGRGLINPPAPSTGLRRSQLLSAAPARSGALENGAKTPDPGGGRGAQHRSRPLPDPPPAAAAVIPELSFGLLTPVFGTSLPEQPGWGRGGADIEISAGGGTGRPGRARSGGVVERGPGHRCRMRPRTGPGVPALPPRCGTPPLAAASPPVPRLCRGRRWRLRGKGAGIPKNNSVFDALSSRGETGKPWRDMARRLQPKSDYSPKCAFCFDSNTAGRKK